MSLPHGAAARLPGSGIGRVLLLHLLPWWVLLPAIALALHHFQSRADLARLEIRERAELLPRVAALEAASTRLNNDIRLMVSLSASTIARLPSGAALEDALASTFEAFLAAHRHYSQARLLDTRCVEQVRVDRRAGAIQRIEAARLQDKSGRDYCTRPLALPAGARFLSHLDANIEDGKVVRPIEPTLRASAVVHDAEDQPVGVVVLNFDAGPMLAAFIKASTAQMSLLDEDGYWIHAPDPRDEFGFADGDAARRFPLRHPAVWESLRSAHDNAGSFEDEAGLWTYRRVEADPSGAAPQAPVWYALSLLPRATLDTQQRGQMWRLFAITALTLLVVTVLATALVRGRLRLMETATSLHERNLALKDALDELAASRDELLRQEKLSSLGLLVAGVAHELNTPLGAATLAASALQEQLQRLQAAYGKGIRRSDLETFANDQQRGLELLLHNLERANALSRRFKQVAADRSNASRQRFALEQVVADVLALSHSSLKHAVSRVETEVPPELMLDSYPGPLGQVIQNLVMNAALHAFPGGRKGSIRIEAGARGETLDLWVSDDGCGVPAEHRERIWDPFFTTRRNDGGTGLGLHICHQIVTAVLGGEITLEDAPDGRGTRMRVAIPLVAPDDVPDARLPIAADAALAPTLA